MLWLQIKDRRHCINAPERNSTPSTTGVKSAMTGMVVKCLSTTVRSGPTGTDITTCAADVVAVEGDVLADITNLQHKEKIRLVTKEGGIFVDTLSSEHKYVIHPDPGQIKFIDNM